MDSSHPLSLTCLRFSAAPGPQLLVTAGVHGDEFEPMVAVHRLAEAAESVLERGRLTLCPVVNEGAMRLGRRTAEDGLDLARICPGADHGTLTEQAASALSRLIRDSDAYVDLHTGGLALDVWPLAGYMLHADPPVCETQRRLARAFGLPVMWGTDPGLEGRTLSVARDAGVPAIYAEYGGGARFQVEAVEALVAGCLGVMNELGMTRPREPLAAPRLAIEDPRPASGHMQICHPAPSDGLFLPAVRTGELVARGGTLGTIVHLPDGARQEVYADRSGRVLVLRVLPAVRRGDGLAVIVETGESA